MAYNPFRDPESSYNNPKKGPHSSGAPGGGIPLRGPLSPEQEAYMNKGRRAKTTDSAVNSVTSPREKYRHKDWDRSAKGTGFLETPGSTGRPMSKYNKEYSSPSSEGDRFSMQDRRAQGQAESEEIIRNADYDSSGMDRNIFNNRRGKNPYNPFDEGV